MWVAFGFCLHCETEFEMVERGRLGAGKADVAELKNIDDHPLEDRTGVVTQHVVLFLSDSVVALSLY